MEGCWLPLIWPSGSRRIHTVALPARPREGGVGVGGWVVEVAVVCALSRYKKRRDCKVHLLVCAVVQYVRTLSARSPLPL